MTNSRDASAILFWTNETDPSLAEPDSARRLSDRSRNQRVVRVIARKDGWADIRFGNEKFSVSETCLTVIEPLQMDVGDTVAFSAGHGTIRDILWHFKDGVPNYYLEQGGRKLSKRYLTADLVRV